MRALAQAPVLRPEEIRSRPRGRYKINQKLEKHGVDVRATTRDDQEDFISSMKYSPACAGAKARSTTSITWFAPRAHRGELLANPVPRRPGPHGAPRQGAHDLVRREHRGHDSAEAHQPKALSAVIRDFFGRSQLSQFMDQTNRSPS